MSIKAVGFDIDGTLYPNYKMFVKALPSFLRHPKFVYHFGKTRKALRSFSYSKDFHTMQAEVLAGRLGKEIEEVKTLISKNLYQAWDISFKGISPYPAVPHVLQSFKQAGLGLAALSDFPVGSKLESLGVSSYMDFWFSSEETGYLKPHSLPFKRLIKEFGIPPASILYVGNSYRYDIVGAKAAGLKTAYLVQNNRHNNNSSKNASERHEKADFTFSCFYTLRDWVLENIEK